MTYIVQVGVVQGEERNDSRVSRPPHAELFNKQ